MLLVLPVLILDALLLSGMEGAWRFTPQNFVRLDLKGKTLTRYRHGQETERLQLDGQYGLYHVPAGRLYGGGYIALSHAAAGEKGRLLDHRHISPLFAGSRADKRLCRLLGERMSLPSRPD